MIISVASGKGGTGKTTVAVNPARNVIIDVPPGTSCPVIETVKGRV